VVVASADIIDFEVIVRSVEAVATRVDSIALGIVVGVREARVYGGQPRCVNTDSSRIQCFDLRCGERAGAAAGVEIGNSAIAQSIQRNGAFLELRTDNAGVVVLEEIEELVPHDRAAHGAPKLILDEVVAWDLRNGVVAEPGVRNQTGIAVILV